MREWLRKGEEEKREKMGTYHTADMPLRIHVSSIEKMITFMGEVDINGVYWREGGGRGDKKGKERRGEMKGTNLCESKGKYRNTSSFQISPGKREEGEEKEKQLNKEKED